LTWENPGELTEVGERQHYLLGRLRRHQYIELEELLPKQFTPSLLYLYSTNFNRTQMSLQSYLLGLYPYGIENLNDNQVNNSMAYLMPYIELQMNKSVIKELGKHPMPFNIPVHFFTTSEVKNEGLLLYESCEYADDAIKKLYYGNSRYLKTYEKYEDIWKELTHFYPEITEDYLKKGRNAVDVCDLILCTDSESRRPYFISNKLIDRMYEFIGNVMIEELTITPIALNISLHKATREVVNWMDAAVNKTSKVKYTVYSTHDTTLIFLMLGLNKLNETIRIDRRPPLSGNMNFVLDDKREVVISYCGKIVHKELYETFREKFLNIGNIGDTTREKLCQTRV
jgi:acid phosphatase